MQTRKRARKNTLDTVAIKEARNLFFDILRIVAVCLIVIHHLPGIPLSPDSVLYHFLYNNGISLTYHTTAGPLGVYILVFISGAVLHLSYRNKDIRYWDFIYKRIKRVYPSWWMTMTLYYLLFPAMLLSGIYLIPQLLGLLPSPAYYNWWIGLFVSLYFVYPPLKKLVTRYPYATLFGAFFLTITTRIMVSSVIFNIFDFPTPVFMLDRVILPCFIFEFVLGMVLIEKGFYLKRTHHSSFISWISEVSYYVFLLHPLIRNAMFSSDMSQLWRPRHFILYLLVTILLSAELMSLDRFLQKILPKKLPRASEST